MIQAICVLGALALLFVLGQVATYRKDRVRSNARKSMTFEDFIRDEDVTELPEEVSQAVYEQLSEILGYPPIGTDNLSEDFGLVGGDLEDLISECLRTLKVAPRHEGTQETGVVLVSDLVRFLTEYRVDAPA